jgi:hypothetical protein
MIVILLTIVAAGANIGLTLAILRKQVSASANTKRRFVRMRPAESKRSERLRLNCTVDLGPAVAMLFARLRGSLKLYATEAKRYLWQGDTAW